jgi:hypothetical protein
MPYIDAGLPFSGTVPLSRHTSRAGADDAAPRALSQTVRYLRLLKDRPHGLTDAQAAQQLGIERSSVNARRAVLVKADLVFAAGTRLGPTGKVHNVVWKAR